jgi:hypothetical protein
VYRMTSRVLEPPTMAEYMETLCEYTYTTSSVLCDTRL